MKRYLLTLLILSSLITPLAGCASGQPVKVAFSDLISNPERYDGKEIIIEGYWFDGFEIVVLAERLEPSSFAEGNLQPGGVKIWIKGGLSEEVSSQLYLQPNNSTGYPAHYGKVELTGKLEYGEQYGHMNAYQYQMTVTESRLLPWAPPQLP
jgi:hypothetical protein